ncbi:MAG: hypothetical protein AB8G96_00985 [Phycisphaerales bacterium]
MSVDPGAAGGTGTMDEVEPTSPPPPPAYPTPEWGRTDGAGQRIDDDRGRIFPCERCGADLEFHIGEQAMQCPFCGATRTVETEALDAVREQDYAAELERQRAMRAEAASKSREAEGDRSGGHGSGAGDSANDLNEVRCSACGGSVQFPGTLSSSECAFCGSPVQRTAAHAAPERVPVDGVLPFGVDERRAGKSLASWVGSRWFAPTEFKRRGATGKFRGVYLPYWTFDSHTGTHFRGQRGDHYYVTVGSGKNKRRERRTRWRRVSGEFERFFDDVLIVAADGVHQKLVTSLEPWPLDQMLPFNRQVMAGFLAQTYDVELEPGFGRARTRIDAALLHDVRRRIGGDEQRVEVVQSSYDPITYKHVLLPVWLLVYKYRDRSFQVVVNAMTGEVQGERPYSAIKIALATLAGLVGIGGATLVAALVRGG